MKKVVLLIFWPCLIGVVSSCDYFSTFVIPQPTNHREQPFARERTRIFETPYGFVWDGAEHVMRGKQAVPVLVDREAGLLRFVLQDATSIMVYVKAVDSNRTKVYVRRSRGATISESAILDEIGNTIASQRK